MKDFLIKYLLGDLFSQWGGKCVCPSVFISPSFLMLFSTPAPSLNTAANIYTSDQHDEWCKFDGGIMDGRAMMAYSQPFITLRGLTWSSEYQHEQLWKEAELLHILRQMTIWIYTGFMSVASTGFGEQCVGIWGGMFWVCAQVYGYLCVSASVYVWFPTKVLDRWE